MWLTGHCEGQGAVNNHPSQSGRNNTTVAVMCLCVVAGMVALSFAAVPLYRVFCQLTGFAGTTQRADAPAARTLERMMTVQFDANVSAALPWKFTPAQRQITLQVGEQVLALYRAQNTSQLAITGTATFNVSPPSAGAYFNKVECFCFTEQSLKPGQAVDMPVTFFIDPDIEHDDDLRSLTTITLSYTFYPVPQPVKTTAASGKLQHNSDRAHSGTVN